MIRPSGHLFHLDFGFCFGSNPSAVPQGPFRLSREMVEALGGRGHPTFEDFTRLCVEVGGWIGGCNQASRDLPLPRINVRFNIRKKTHVSHPRRRIT